MTILWLLETVLIIEGIPTKNFPLWDNTLLHNILPTYGTSCVNERGAQILGTRLPSHYILYSGT